MPYFVFNNFMIFFNEIIEEENKGSKNSDADNDYMGNAQKMMSNQMSAAKNMMKTSTPKLK